MSPPLTRSRSVVQAGVLHVVRAGDRRVGDATGDCDRNRTRRWAVRARETLGEVPTWSHCAEPQLRGGLKLSVPAQYRCTEICPHPTCSSSGRLTAVIDFGCSAIGDAAGDAAIAWTFFHGDSRDTFRTRLPLDDATEARGRGWALW